MRAWAASRGDAKGSALPIACGGLKLLGCVAMGVFVCDFFLERYFTLGDRLWGPPVAVTAELGVLRTAGQE